MYRGRLLPFLAATCLIPFVGTAQVASAQILSQGDLARSPAVDALNSHISVLARSPRDLTALIGAGEAALELEDPQAAMGFFGRADDVSPSNGRVKAGLGRAMLGLQQTSNALRLLEQAGSLGYSDARMLSDRGLARDLSGNQAGAQRDYATALRLAPSDADISRRYAVSLGIAGQVEQADAVLRPLIAKNDRAAWRMRAFILAMNGQRSQSNDITNRIMPPQMATAITPYMDRMPLLTAVQRAEAVHLGKFPPELIRQPVPPAAAMLAQADNGSSGKGRRKRKSRDAEVAAATPALPTPPSYYARNVPSVTSAPPRATAPVVSAPAARSAPVTSPAPSSWSLSRNVAKAEDNSIPPPIDYSRTDASANARAAEVASAPVRKAPPVAAPVRPAAPVIAAPAVTPAPVPQQQPAAPMLPYVSPVVQAAPAVPPAATSDRSLADIIADIRVPDDAPASSVTPVNLDEVRAIQEAKRKAKLAAEAKAKKEAELKAKREAEAKAAAERKRIAANPARIWVQIATGRNRAGLSYDIKRLRKQYGDVLGSKGAGVVTSGNGHLLLIGPFNSTAKAKDMVAGLNKAGNPSFVYNSEPGEEVTLIGGK